jgi:hypothetical protein
MGLGFVQPIWARARFMIGERGSSEKLSGIDDVISALSY